MNKMKRSFRLLLAVLSLLSVSAAFTACGSKTLYSEGDGELSVVCTGFPPFDLAREVGGDRIKITILQDSGADLHNYTPTSATLEALNRADVFIYIGGESDEWIEDAVAASQNENLVLLPLIDAVTPIHAELECDWHEHEHEHEHSHDDGHDHTHGDEHIWTSLVNAKLTIGAIKDAFCKIDPENTDIYAKNAENYVQRLDLLDNEYKEFFESGKIDKMVFADRFPFVYLLHDYQIPYIAAFSGCSAETNSSFSMQIGLIEAVRESNTDCIFVIEGGDKTLAEAISRETGCKILSLNSMQSIKRGDIEKGAKYIDIMEQNLNVLKEAVE